MSGISAKDYSEVSSRRQRRRLAAIARLNELMKKPDLTPTRMAAIEVEHKNLHDRINGIKKQKKAIVTANVTKLHIETPLRNQKPANRDGKRR